MPITDGTGDTWTVTHRKDPWVNWNITASQCSTTSSAFDDPWSPWNQTITITTAGTGDPWVHWMGQIEGRIDLIMTTGTTIEFIREQGLVWSAWAHGPQIIVRRSYDERMVEDERRREREREEYRQSPEYRAEAERIEAAALESAERWEAKHAEEKRLREIAEDKAEHLLMSVLTPEQRDEYHRLQSFRVHTPSGNIYRVKRGRMGNLKRIELDSEGREKVVETLCVHPRINVPNQDTMIAQKLMLETNEDELRALANISRYR